MTTTNQQSNVSLYYAALLMLILGMQILYFMGLCWAKLKETYFVFDFVCLCRFSSGVELAHFLAGLDPIHGAWSAIQETRLHCSDSPFSVTYRLSGGVLSFVSSPDFNAEHLRGEGSVLVSSETLGNEFPAFDFLWKVGQSFFIRKAAVDLYASVHDQLTKLKDQMDPSKPLIITGHSMGGSIATLFALWMQNLIDLQLQNQEKASPNVIKLPICITFGSPLLGDGRFQQAVSERPAWASCFLSVVSNKDPIPAASLFSLNGDGYKPFGTFLFCSESQMGGCACFEEREMILEALAAARASFGNSWSGDYETILDHLKKKAMIRGDSEFGDADLNTLQAGITLQLAAIGVITTLEGNDPVRSLVTGIEEREKTLKRKRNVYEPARKLNDMKTSMALMEWYKKVCEAKGGYYACYKNPQTIGHAVSHGEIVMRQRRLTLYWQGLVEEKEKMPQKEGAKLRTRWLFGGNNFRRIVEPLDIAYYYHREGKRDYVNQGRSKHYKLLEKWMNESGTMTKPRTKPSSLTEDSCFWAHVEEAILSCKALKDTAGCDESKRYAMESLVKFENYVMDMIRSFSVATEIFLEHSTFMEWWSEYNEIKGHAYRSELAYYMRKGDYKSYA